MNKGLIFCIFLAVFLVLLNYSLSLMAGNYIIGSLGGNRFTSVYTITFFSIGNALSVPLGRFLANQFGLKKSIFSCLTLLALFTWLCAEAPTYPVFIIGRLFQGLVSGPMFILGARALPKKNYVAQVNLTMFIMAPIIGACIGGWIAYDYNWQWLFYADAPLCFLLALIIGLGLKEERRLPAPSYDFIGYFFYFIGILCIGIVLTTGQELDWFRSNLINALLIIGVVFFTFSILRSNYHPHPFLNFRLFRNRIFSYAFINLAFLFSAYFGMIILLSLWLSLDANYTPLWIGVILGSMALVGYLPPLLIYDKMLCDCRIILVAALLCLIWSSFRTESFNVEINFGRIAFSRALAGLGVALFVPAIFRLCFHSFQTKRAESVIELFQVIRSLASGLGASLYSILWQRRLVFYHDRLGSDLTPFSQETKDFFSQASLFNINGEGALELLNNFLNRQSHSLALDDCFYLMGWIMVGLLVLCFLTLFLDRALFFPERKFMSPAPLSNP